MNLLKSVKTPTLIACIAAVAIGLLILIWPVFILRFICILLALGLICIGGLRLMTYFKDIAVIAENTQIIFLFPFLLCLVVCFATFMMLQRTYDLYKAHVADWWIIGILALIGLVLSIILLATNRTAMLALGLDGSLILTGLSLIYSAAAVIAMEIFIELRLSKNGAARKNVRTAPASKTLDE